MATKPKSAQLQPKTAKSTVSSNTQTNDVSKSGTSKSRSAQPRTKTAKSTVSSNTLTNDVSKSGTSKSRSAQPQTKTARSPVSSNTVNNDVSKNVTCKPRSAQPRTKTPGCSQDCNTVANDASKSATAAQAWEDQVVQISSPRSKTSAADAASELSAQKGDGDDGDHKDSPDGCTNSGKKKIHKSLKKEDGLDASDKVLLATLQTLKIKKESKSKTTQTINKTVDLICDHMSQNSDCFKKLNKLRTGSFYENVKICEPDEFDVMLTIPVYRVSVEPFDEEGAFYSISFKRDPNTRPYTRFLKDSKISASEMLAEFREHVKQAVRNMEGVTVERKKKGCPAVTLQIKVDKMTVGLDIVFGLEVHHSSWPPFTTTGLQIDTWLGTKKKMEYKREPFYLVPKYEGKGAEEKGGVCARDAWRISFSHVEKSILKDHGKTKTCCEKNGAKCCRKACLKLLKYLLYLLKERHPKQLTNFCSYLGKTVLLHACATKVDDSYWAEENLYKCFVDLLQDFMNHLKSCELPNFFIPSHNLLGSVYTRRNCIFLVECINNEIYNGFKIFEAI